MTDNDSTTTTDVPHIAITGAAGYIGSRIAKEIQETHPDWALTAIDNFYLAKVDSIGDLDIDHVDIRHRDRLETALEGADVVLHLAAVSGVDDCDENQDLAYDVNVQGTNNVAWFCRKTGAGLVFPFSMAILGDPQEFPITVDQARDPLNWYGRTKFISEKAIDAFAEGAFPAHQYMISNLYGGHEVDGTTVSKGTVINFFVSRALAGEPITVYEPGTQARNYVHVTDVATAYVRSCERLLDQLEAGETGVEKYEVASDEDPSVETVAHLVADIAREEAGLDPEVKLVENPRADAETLTDTFTVDTTKAREKLGWTPERNIESVVREIFAAE